ncbi:MAG: substrate-binding domain-containing protein [Chloroflexi bacterium]|nr:substrate-binding domain-containing protein [Chloroflexota bacterium]
MRIGLRGAGVALASASLIVAAAAPTLAQDASQAPGDWPLSGTLRDGTPFTLAPRIAEKLALNADADPGNDVPIQYVFSYGSASIPLFSPQYERGYQRSIPEAQAIMPQLSGTPIAPASQLQDPNLQIAQISALWQAGLVDCLSIQSTGANAFTQIVNDIMADGIPVFTVGVESNGNELTNFTQISHNEGRQAAQIVADWIAETGNDIKVFAVSGGDPTQNWSQGRMQGFIEGITELVPDARFVNDASSALNTTYDPANTYDAYRAFLLGNPDVQFIENVDIGAEHANRAIRDSGLAGKVFSIGWNVSQGQLDGIEEGLQVAALDQRWGDQAAFGAVACADFLQNGIIRPNSQELLPVTQANLAEARADFESIMGN